MFAAAAAVARAVGWVFGAAGVPGDTVGAGVVVPTGGVLAGGVAVGVVGAPGGVLGAPGGSTQASAKVADVEPGARQHSQSPQV